MKVKPSEYLREIKPVFQKNLVFSREMQVEKNFEGPLAVCLENINVAGNSEV